MAVLAHHAGNRGDWVTPKQQMLDALAALPDEASFEDALYRLYVLYKIQRGLDQADARTTVTREEARRRMARWLA